MRRSTDLMRLLTRAERLLARRIEAIMAAEGHGLDAWRVISLLADGHGHFMTELSDAAFLPPASLTRLLDHLVDENLVYRRVDDVDRRRIRAHLTARGHRLHERVGLALERELASLAIAPAFEDQLAALADDLDPVTRITF
jgi:MarR family transcriptional regulator, organic hydroperoxide resistance regulator